MTETYKCSDVELRRDITQMCYRTAEAMRFYMELHSSKGQWQHLSPELFIEGVLRNLHDFYKAYRAGDEREMMAEGIGIINNIGMFLDNHAKDEMDAVQNWKSLLKEIKERDGDSS